MHCGYLPNRLECIREQRLEKMKMTKPKTYIQTSTCESCGTGFIIKRKWQRFCRPDCRMEYFIRMKKEKRDQDDANAEAQRHKALEMEKKRLEEKKLKEQKPSAPKVARKAIQPRSRRHVRPAGTY
jgi:hypothetical protein